MSRCETDEMVGSACPLLLGGRREYLVLLSET